MSNNNWHPKLKTGFFFIGDQQFYLFASKETKTIDEAKYYKWTLSDTPASIISLTANSKILSPDNVIIDGSDIYINYLMYAAPINISYTVKGIDSGLIVQAITSEVLDINDTSISYFLNPIPISGTPIILTDDSSTPSNYEFGVDMDTGEVTFYNGSPLEGTFEYEGLDSEYATIENPDINPVNNGKVTGILCIDIDSASNINEELY